VSYTVEIDVPVQELREFHGDVVKAVDDWKKEIMLGLKKESMRQSRIYVKDRMPKGGAYTRRIQWRTVESGPKDYISELFNDHQWAEAVEEGTKPHPITSNKLMTARPLLSMRGDKSRPWGVKYGTGVVRGKHFEHPGSRAFWIFRDTATRMGAVAGKIVNDAFRRVKI